MTGPRHPLPESEEARHGEKAERDEREKGQGDEGGALIQPSRPAVNPDGEPYRYDDLGRGPGTAP